MGFKNTHVNTLIGSLSLLAIVFVTFQNCSQPFRSNEPVVLESKIHAQGGDGVPFDGKISAAYSRIIPGHRCNGELMPHSTIIINNDMATLVTNIDDKCNVKQPISMASLKIPFFSEKMVGYEQFIYRNDLDKNAIYEAWCWRQIQDDPRRIVNILIETDLNGETFKDIVIVDDLDLNAQVYKSEVVETNYVIRDFRKYDEAGLFWPRIHYERKNPTLPPTTGWAKLYDIYLNIRLLRPQAGEGAYSGNYYSSASWNPYAFETWHAMNCFIGGDLESLALSELVQ